MPYPPSDPVALEAAITQAVVDVWKGVAGIGQVWAEDELETLAEDDVTASTTLDPVSNVARTDIVIVSLEGWNEAPYSNDDHTQLSLRYGIGYDLEYARWSKAGLTFASSTAQFKAVLLRARKAFKDSPQLGYEGVSHKLLQLANKGLTRDEETGGRFHSADLTLTVIVSGFAF